MATKPGWTSDNPAAGEQTVTVAQVTFGPITPDDEAAKYEDASAEPSAIYPHYTAHNYFERDHHRYIMPIASPYGFKGASAAFVQLAQSTLVLVSNWTVLRAKIFPQAPDPDLSDSDWVLLDEHYNLPSITVIGDGVTPLYRISGTYVYGHKNPSSLTSDELVFPRPPWLKDEFARIVPHSIFQQGLIDLPIIISPPPIPRAPGV